MTRQEFAVISMAISRDAATWCCDVLNDATHDLNQPMGHRAMQRFADQIAEHVARIERAEVK